MFVLSQNRKLARKPSEGPYYVVKYKDKWAVEAFPGSEYESMGHIEAWRNYIMPALLKSYDRKLSTLELEELQSAYTGIPRGRVSYTGTDLSLGITVPGEKPGVWYVDHGGNLPPELGLEKLKNLVIQAFGLHTAAAQGRVEWRIAPHEKMDPEDTAIVQRLVFDEAAKSKLKSLTRSVASI